MRHPISDARDAGSARHGQVRESHDTSRVRFVGPWVGRVAREAAWAPVLVVMAHEAGARLLGHEPYVDPVMHFLGGSAIAFFVYRLCRIGGSLLGAPSRVVVDLLAFGLTCSVALMWEFGEFLSDLFLGTHAHRSVTNTLRDLSLGVMGAVTCVVASHVLASRTLVGRRDG